MNYLKEYKNIVFEDIKHIDEDSNEYWYARELQIVLGYRQWRSIKELIDRAMIACKESSYDINDHFAVERKMIKIATSKDIREFIKIHGWTMPEDFPTPNKSIDEIKIDKYIGE